MRTKRLLVVALVVLAIAGAMAVTLADYLEIERNPPGGSGCVCPAIWEPVACRAPDGSIHGFSNGCVAACYGFTQCARIAVPGP
jgi:hypothetical protein